MKAWNMDQTTEWFASHPVLFRTLGLTTLVLALVYILWRYFFSLNLQAPWFSIPLVLAETYGVVDLIFLILMVWKPAHRKSLKPDFRHTADVFITTYNEEVEILEPTLRAALKIQWPQVKVYVLDDGNRPHIKSLVESLGARYITRGQEWAGKPRHAKAGNINNALLQTDGEFILILDTDQIPDPRILKKTLRYFEDPQVALVQTPQYFYNVPSGDPFGVDAPLFYGPIMQGKDGWNAAFFCGSNGILRREALMQSGLVRYVQRTTENFRQGLIRLEKYFRTLRLENPEDQALLKSLRQELKQNLQALNQGQPLSRISDQVKQQIHKTLGALSHRDLLTTAESLKALAESGDEAAAQAYQFILGSLQDLGKNLSAQESLGLAPETLAALDVTLAGEAIPVQALSTVSITEDMSTALNLHSQGWKSVYHPQILAKGLSPEDLGTMLTQRLRWAQGTIQVLKNQNPLTLPGLTPAQRFLYFASIFSYFSGFATLVFLAAPIIFLFTNISPVTAWSWLFFTFFIPFYLANKIFFMTITRGIPLWRGEQYNTALFPVWIQAVLSVFLNWKITFQVTPKQRQAGNFLPLVWPQILVMVLTGAAVLYQTVLFVLGQCPSYVGYFINGFWGVYNMIMLSVIVRAAVYK